MSTATCSYELRESVAIVRMDDGKANALSYPMIAALDDALTRAEREAQAVVLTGRPGKFCAGFDLKEMMAGIEQALAIVRRGGDLLLRMYALPMPLVIACSGHAVAGGALTVLTGDLRVGVRGAYRIGLNEVQLGLPLPVLGMELARDRLAPRELTRATLFAASYTPDEALAAGWLDELADEPSLLDTAVAHATRLAALPRRAYAMTKTALREKTLAYIRDTIELDTRRIAASSQPAG